MLILIFEALQFDLLKFKFLSLSSKIQKIPEFQLCYIAYVLIILWLSLILRNFNFSTLFLKICSFCHNTIHHRLYVAC